MKYLSHILIGIFAACSLLVFPEEPQYLSYDIPLDNPIYDDLNAMIRPDHYSGFDYSIRPYAQMAIQPYADSLGFGIIKKPLFAFLYQTKSDSVIVYPFIRTKTAYQDSNFSFLGMKAYAIDSLSNKKELLDVIHTGLTVNGRLGKMIVFFQGRIITQHSTLQLWEKENNPRIGSNQTTILSEVGKPGHLIGYDDFVSYIKIPTNYLNIKLGKDNVSWGYSADKNLLFSGMAPAFFNLQLEKKIGPLSYSFIWGRLLADTYDQKRYVYAKRLTYKAISTLTLGFAEQVVSINRDIEPIYFIPFLPFYFSEHYIGDLDNRLMSFDASFFVKQRLLLFSEILMDDMRNLTGFFHPDDISNKWGILAGLKYFDPIPRHRSLLTCEYSQIEPWVYTTSAKYNGSYYNHPIQFGSLLGNPLGPNSRDASIKVFCRFSNKYSGTIKAENIWKGGGLGSLIYDTNILADTIGSSVHTTQLVLEKANRFRLLTRQRTIASGTFDFQPFSWNLYSITASIIHERRPKPGNYTSLQVSSFWNF